MSVMKTLLDEILNCNSCNGHGFIGWTSGKEYDFEYCSCNPHSLPDPKQVA